MCVCVIITADDSRFVFMLRKWADFTYTATASLRYKMFLSISLNIQMLRLKYMLSRYTVSIYQSSCYCNI